MMLREPKLHTKCVLYINYLSLYVLLFGFTTSKNNYAKNELQPKSVVVILTNLIFSHRTIA
jgi:hypothetical protein